MVNVAGMRHFRLATICPIKAYVGMHRATLFLIESIRADHWTLVLLQFQAFLGN